MTASPPGDTAATAGDTATMGTPATAPVRTIFFGSGPFAVPMLHALLGLPSIHVVAAVSVPDRPAGRGRAPASSPLSVSAAARNVPLLQPASLRTSEAVDAVAAYRPALGVLADYGRVVPATILELPARGFLNVHPSLLPKHRGAAPIAGAILAGDAETGVTIIRMDAGLDTGPIVAAEAWPLTGSETAPEVERRAAEVGARLLAGVIPAWLAGTAEARPQPSKGATLTKPLRREDGRLDGSEPAAASERRVRAFDPWPGTFIELERRDSAPDRVAVVRAGIAPAAPGDDPGHLVADGRGIALATIDGRLRLLDVRPAGGRPMTGEAWLRGRSELVGSVAVPRTRETRT
jgi:methionyl-tRNA formyltransferase